VCSFTNSEPIAAVRWSLIPHLNGEILSPLQLIIAWIDPLAAADLPGQRDHLGDVDAKGAVAAGAQHAAVPDDIADLLEHPPVEPFPLFVKRADRMDKFVRGHIFWVPLVVLIHETALRAQAAAGADLEKQAHLFPVAVQQSLDILRISGCVAG